MRFEWDEAKSRSNWKKHSISFDLAVEVFSDPLCLTLSDRVAEGEQRFWTIGRLGTTVVLVVHTIAEEHGEEVIRVISARKATPRERMFYEEVDP